MYPQVKFFCFFFIFYLFNFLLYLCYSSIWGFFTMGLFFSSQIPTKLKFSQLGVWLRDADWIAGALSTPSVSLILSHWRHCSSSEPLLLPGDRGNTCMTSRKEDGVGCRKVRPGGCLCTAWLPQRGFPHLP